MRLDRILNKKTHCRKSKGKNELDKQNTFADKAAAHPNIYGKFPFRIYSIDKLVKAMRELFKAHLTSYLCTHAKRRKNFIFKYKQINTLNDVCFVAIATDFIHKYILYDNSC